MKILQISTLNHNPGDEIIRLGVDHLVRRAFPGASVRICHKHDPRTLFSGFKQRPTSPRRLVAPSLYRLYASTLGRRQENYLETADLVVFAGTPFIWRSTVRLFRFTCENAEWVGPTWRRLFNEYPEKLVINLAAGTSVTNQEQYDGILKDAVVKGFLKKATERARLTTSRDIKTQQILRAAGAETPLLPCVSILAAQGAELTPQPAEYVVVNLMPSAAHQWRGQRGDSEHWKQTVLAAVADIERRHPILFVSHSEDEDSAAAEWFPQHRRFFSKNPLELLKAYSKARYGLCNRVHATAAIASFGRPAIVVGGDSRINLIAQFGLPAYDHREMDGQKLTAAIGVLEENYDEYAAKLSDRIRLAEHEYLAAISSALNLRQPVLAG